MEHTEFAPGVIEEREKNLNLLRQLLNDGEVSGNAEYSYNDFIAELDRENHA